MNSHRPGRFLWMFGLLASAVGCHHTSPPPATSPMSVPATTRASNEQFESHGISLRYPSEWKSKPSDGYVLLITKGDPELSISLDVPSLPAHLPGFIPLGLVANGYLDDLKKQHPGVAVGKPEDTKVAGANAKRVCSQSGSHIEDAVLTVHGDRVYILRLNSTVDRESGARALLNEIISTVQWTKD